MTVSQFQPRQSDSRVHCSSSALHQPPTFTCIPSPDNPPYLSAAILTEVAATTLIMKASGTTVHMKGQLHGEHTKPISDLHRSQALLVFFRLYMANPSPINGSCAWLPSPLLPLRWSLLWFLEKYGQNAFGKGSILWFHEKCDPFILEVISGLKLSFNTKLYSGFPSSSLKTTYLISAHNSYHL